MRVQSTNISEKRIIHIQGEEVETGMYKISVGDGIFLTKNGVNSDTVCDLRYHGGHDKACYLFGKNNYSYFQKLYPEAKWETGFFGENIELDFLDESNLNIGDVYQLGEARIQIAQPRVPCSKLGYRFENMSGLKAFIESPHPGAYVRVLQDGKVKAGDEMILIEAKEQKLTLLELYRIRNNKSKFADRIDDVLKNPYVTVNVKTKLEKWVNK
jgi:MOSC domain-containing protein YiiM